MIIKRLKNHLTNIKSNSDSLRNIAKNIWKLLGLEGTIWLSAIIYLSLISTNTEDHFTFCPLANLGFENCPGCGLGKSVSLIIHGNIFQSFDYHYLGIPALLIIIFRLYQIIKINYQIHFKSINKGVNHAQCISTNAKS